MSLLSSSLLFLLSLLFVLVNLVSCVRNVEEEAICQPFLTSRWTSPLIANLVRDLRVDENGEFSCELVLQDDTLPMQIRFTIHEGLSWLAVRHVHMGEPSHNKVLRHLTEMTKIAPSQHQFALRAARWAADPHNAKPFEAAAFYRQAMFGRGAKNYANDSSITETDRYTNTMQFAKMLSLSGQHEEALPEYEELLRINPLDYNAAFLLDETLAALNRTYSETSGANRQIQSAFDAVADRLVDLYTGFRPPISTWQPRILTDLPSAEEFQAFVARREPVVIRTGSSSNLGNQLRWDIDLFNDIHKLIVEAGNESVAVEMRNLSAHGEGVFGFGTATYRKIMPFSSFLIGYYTSGGLAKGSIGLPAQSTYRQFEELYGNVKRQISSFEGIAAYLNTQLDLADGVFRPPLNRLQSRFPTPGFLNEIGHMESVTLWMGHTKSGVSGKHSSRMHFDSTDNLYVLAKGQKSFRILPPNELKVFETVSPTFAISPNGLSYQVRRFMIDRILAAKENNTAFDFSKIAASFRPPEDGDSELFHFIRGQRGTPSADPVVDLEAGDMLYLPTGWLHEVSSGQGQHIAVNYWWRPPFWQQSVTLEQQLLKDLITSFNNVDAEHSTFNDHIEL